jgi:hypothetical protein
MAELVSALCSAGVVIFFESEYAYFRIFKRKTSLFSYVCQLSILSTALQIAVISIVYFIPSLRILPMLVVITIIKFLTDSSYPMMILLRLRLVILFPTTIMYIPLVLAAILAGLRYFWTLWILTGDKYYFNIYYIIQPITSTLLAIEDISINVFFIIVAIKHFNTVIRVKNIILECVKVTVEFTLPDVWITSSVISIVIQIKTRLQIMVLANIVGSARERRTPTSTSQPSNPQLR